MMTGNTVPDTAFLIASLLAENSPSLTKPPTPTWLSPSELPKLDPSKKRAGRGRPRKDAAPTPQPTAPPAVSSSATSKEQSIQSPNEGALPSYSESGRKKRKDTGVKKSCGRGWSEEEEERFEEALRLHGRDWRLCADYIKTRDHRQVASHAQKHFIRLFIQNKPLPVKVQESGEGYTLSGKPLDLNSAAARQYGLNTNTNLKTAERSNAHSTDPISSPNPRVSISCAPSNEIESSYEDDSDNPTTSFKNSSSSRYNTRKSERESKTPISVQDGTSKRKHNSQSMPNPPNRSDSCRAGYSSSPQLNSDSLALALPRAFPGQPLTTPQSQPFFVQVSRDALLIMELHAHLCNYETIGLLGGRWEPENSRLAIVRAFPGDGQHANRDVKMCSLSEARTRLEVERENLQVVGWYHSHPLFQPNPSCADIEIQAGYQNSCRDSFSNVEPFIGLIVGTFDPLLLTPKSQMLMFCTRKDSTSTYPCRLQYSISHSLPGNAVFDVAKDLIDKYRNDEDARADLNRKWETMLGTDDGGENAQKTITKFEKLLYSLSCHFKSRRLSQPTSPFDETLDRRLNYEESLAATPFLSKLFSYIEESWNIKLPLENCNLARHERL